MQIKLYLVVMISFGLMACTTGSRATFGPLNGAANEFVGWLDAEGEWALFPSKITQKYDPYAPEEMRCVSLVNDMDQPRAAISPLDRRKVRVRGYLVDYDSLNEGTSPSDKLLSKRYYRDQPVENSCLRRDVIIAREILPID